jgi:hypothetical protein
MTSTNKTRLVLWAVYTKRCFCPYGCFAESSPSYVKQAGVASSVRTPKPPTRYLGFISTINTICISYLWTNNPFFEIT